MKITQRFSAAIQGFKTANNSMGQNLGRQFLKYGSQQPDPTVQDWAQLLMRDEDFYTGHGYAAVNNRANRVVTLATDYLRTTANKSVMEEAKKKEEDVKHPYLKLIEDSPTFSDDAFWYMISTYLDLEGVFYLMAVRNGDGSRIGKVLEFKLLNPYEVTRVYSNSDTTKIEGYIEIRDGMSREIPPHMIIEIRKFNPFSRTDPFSMSDAARDAQFTLKQSGDHMRNSINRNNKFPGIVQIGESEISLDPQQLANFKSRVLSKDKRGEPIFATGVGAPKWADMQLDLKKSAPDIVNEISMKTLTAVTGNSKTMSGIEESGTTRDTSKTQKDLFTESHAIPQARLITSALNQDYKNSYPEDYKEFGYKIAIENPLGTDHEAELSDIEVRKESHDLYTTLRNNGYSHEIAAKYAAGDIELMDIGEPTEKKEPVVVPPTVPPVDEKKPETPSKEKVQQTNENQHDHTPAIHNQLAQDEQGTLGAQQGMLQNAIVNIEEKLVASVLNKVTKNQFEEQSDIISEEEKEAFENELEIAIAAFYALILPLYARNVMSRRLTEFGKFGDFKLNNDVQTYIKTTAKKASESHINTIVDDLLKTTKKTYDNLVQRAVEAIKGGPEGAGKTDDQIFKLARKKALEGAGQQEIASAIRKEYTHISANRAKTIARTETNRAFTQSQYQADKQFIKQNNLEGRAYKKWITRSGNPCALCQAKAAQAPIPFDKAFAELGDEITAVEEVDGKTRVLKQKITYETVEAGNLHVNCSCIYQLIVE